MRSQGGINWARIPGKSLDCSRYLKPCGKMACPYVNSSVCTSVKMARGSFWRNSCCWFLTGLPIRLSVVACSPALPSRGSSPECRRSREHVGRGHHTRGVHGLFIYSTVVHSGSEKLEHAVNRKAERVLFAWIAVVQCPKFIRKVIKMRLSLQ